MIVTQRRAVDSALNTEGNDERRGSSHSQIDRTSALRWKAAEIAAGRPSSLHNLPESAPYFVGAIAGSFGERRASLKASRHELLAGAACWNKLNFGSEVFLGKRGKQRPVGLSRDENNVVTLVHRLSKV